MYHVACRARQVGSQPNGDTSGIHVPALPPRIISVSASASRGSLAVTSQSDLSVAVNSSVFSHNHKRLASAFALP